MALAGVSLKLHDDDPVGGIWQAGPALKKHLLSGSALVLDKKIEAQISSGWAPYDRYKWRELVTRAAENQ